MGFVYTPIPPEVLEKLTPEQRRQTYLMERAFLTRQISSQRGELRLWLVAIAVVPAIVVFLIVALAGALAR
jgi:hypothetical protein